MNISKSLKAKLIQEIICFIERNGIQHERNDHPIDNTRKLLVFSELLNSAPLEEINSKITTNIELGLKHAQSDFSNANILNVSQPGISAPFGIGTPFGEFFLAIININWKTGELKNLLRSYTHQLMSLSNDLNKKRENEKTHYYFYDVIFSTTGIAYQVLNSNELMADNEVYSDVKMYINYLISLKDNYKFAGKDVPRFHIPFENMLEESEKKFFLNGFIDFGMAHGMLPVFILLAKAQYCGVDVPGLSDAITFFDDIYKKFSTNFEGILSFPAKLSLENFLNDRTPNRFNQGSWCYGNLTILRGLMKISFYLGRNTDYQKYKSMISDFVNHAIDFYGLDKITLCHGLSDVIAIQLSCYYDNGSGLNNEILERNLEHTLKIHCEKCYKDTQRNEEEIYYGQDYKDDFSILNGVGGVISVFNHCFNKEAIYNKAMMID